jgi:hypothetical protein
MDTDWLVAAVGLLKMDSDRSLRPSDCATRKRLAIILA